MVVPSRCVVALRDLWIIILFVFGLLWLCLLHLRLLLRCRVGGDINEQTTRVCPIGRVVGHITVQVGISRAETNGILTGPAADLRIVVTRSVVLQPGLAIQFPSRPFEAVAVPRFG